VQDLIEFWVSRETTSKNAADWEIKVARLTTSRSCTAGRTRSSAWCRERHVPEGVCDRYVVRVVESRSGFRQARGLVWCKEKTRAKRVRGCEETEGVRCEGASESRCNSS
jgi:hypothetical protein